MRPGLVALLIAGVLAPTAHAAQVTVTISGTVQTGTDTSGVFVQKPAVLPHQPFTLVYTFDDTKGKQSVGTCSTAPGTVFSTSIVNTTSSPGTAILTINGRSFSFGGSFGQSLYSRAIVNDNFLCPGYGNSSASYFVQATYGNGGYYGSSYVGDDAGDTMIAPATGTVLTADQNWEHGFTNGNLFNSVFPFYIGVFGPETYVASGTLLASQVAVSGAYSCSAGDSPMLPPATPGVPSHNYVVTDLICSPRLTRSCTAQNVFSFLREFPATVDEEREVNTCDVTYLPPPPDFGASTLVSLLASVTPSSCLPILSTLLSSPLGGHIITYVDASALSVTNVTLPDHPFYPGQVVRSVITGVNGEISIQTIGTGTGPAACWNTDLFWSSVGAAVWHRVDIFDIVPHFYFRPPPRRGHPLNAR